jgi:hypothetical protein
LVYETHKTPKDRHSGPCWKRPLERIQIVGPEVEVRVSLNGTATGTQNGTPQQKGRITVEFDTNVYGRGPSVSMRVRYGTLVKFKKRFFIPKNG